MSKQLPQNLGHGPCYVDPTNINDIITRFIKIPEKKMNTFSKYFSMILLKCSECRAGLLALNLI